MRWWIRCRISITGLILIVVATAAMSRFGLSHMPVPRITAGVAPYFILLPALVGTALVSIVDRGHHLAEARSIRPVGVFMLLGLHIVIAATCAIWWFLLVRAWGEALTWQAIRSVIGYSGLALIGYRGVGGRLGAAAPMLYAIAVATFGRDGGSLAWFPLLPADRIDAWIFVTLLWAVGIAATVTRRAHLVRWERDAGSDTDRA